MKKGLNELFVITIVFICNGLNAQDLDREWWNQTNNWDGITPWESYIMLSPYYLGPNALPVPESDKGLVPEQSSFEIRPEYHFMKGDITTDIYIKSRVAVVKKLISIDFFGVPFEHYNMSESLVVERRARHRDGKGSAMGDFYFGTVVQLVRERKSPDVTLGLFCRTASGTKIEDARHTDTPGYYFDVSAGKSFSLPKKDSYIRPSIMLGFLCWQMNQGQDDAFLFGAGAELGLNKFFCSTSLDGYLGYFGEEKYSAINTVQEVPLKDKPIVYRINAGHKFSFFDLSIGYQQGIHDFRYNTVRISFVYHGR